MNKQKKGGGRPRPPDPSYIGRTEAADHLGTSRQTVKKWAEDGVIPYRMVGTTMWLKEDAVLRKAAELRAKEASKAKRATRKKPAAKRNRHSGPKLTVVPRDAEPVYRPELRKSRHHHPDPESARPGRDSDDDEGLALPTTVPPPSPPPPSSVAAPPLPVAQPEPPQDPPVEGKAKDYSGLGRRTDLRIPQDWGSPDFKGEDEIADEQMAKVLVEMLLAQKKKGGTKGGDGRDEGR